ncbi:hypothetical protein [Bdellovibrio bacteriovorus]|nr:hypothetical protein [Bdellovibrio bacteriovorus]
MKWLDDERYIRIAGALLLASPFFNFFLSVASNPHIPDKWSPTQLWAIFMAATTVQWILRISKIVVGYLMFRGKSSAWVPVLAILGVTIFLNLYTFKKDIQFSVVQAVLGLVVNIILFSIVFRAEFRLNQEVERKLKAVRAAKAASVDSAPRTVKLTAIATKKIEQRSETNKATVVPITKKPVRKGRKVKDFVIARGTVVEFEGFGHFAKVIKCHGDEIWLQGTGELPKDLQSRSLILDSIDRKKSVRLKFNRTQDEQYLVFKIA